MHRQFRLPVQRRGLVRHHNKTTLCEISDLTERGLHFTADLPLALSERAAVEIQLEGSNVIQLELFITQANHPQFGGRIISMSLEDRRRLIHYISELIVACLSSA